MPIYPSTISDRMEPLDDPEPTPVERLWSCIHADACQRVYESLVDRRQFVGKEDEMVAAMQCGACEFWEE